MRLVVYAVAVLAAAGIVYYMGNTNEADVASNTQVAAPAPVETIVDDTTDSSVEMVSLKVPTMHCPFACYPSVKKTLEGATGVQSVDLAAQKEEGTIDNPVVIIKAGSQFDIDQAVAALAASGFAGAEVVP